jgi:hypothetical protein
MEAISWASRYPSGLISVGEDGKISVPKNEDVRSVNKTAEQRGLELINAGTTEKLPDLEFNSIDLVKQASLEESFLSKQASLEESKREMRWESILVLVLLLCMLNGVFSFLIKY